MKYVYQPPVSDASLTPEHFKEYFEFLYERQSIWYKRFVQGQKPPWTNDSILAKYKYTNIYRELDRGTLWLKDKIFKGGLQFAERIKKNTLRNLLWKVCQYRLLNKIETFEAIGLIGYEKYSQDNHDGFFDRLFDLRASGVTVWTDAHITLQCNLKQDRLKNFETILDRLHPNVPEMVDLILTGCGIEEFFNRIKKEYGFGPFISYEVATDLSYCTWNNIDNNDWANPGPGCKFGLNLIFPQYKNTKEYQLGMNRLWNIQEKAFEKYGLDWQKIGYHSLPLSLRNIEHSLCEFGKYWKQQRGHGRARPIYRQKTF